MKSDNQFGLYPFEQQWKITFYYCPKASWKVWMKSTRFAAFTSSSSSLSSPSSSSEGAGLVVGSITSLAGDAVAHTGLEEPSCLSGFNQRGVTWFQHRSSSTAPAHGASDRTGLPRRSVRGSFSTIGRPERSCPQFSTCLLGRRNQSTDPCAIRIHLPPG